MGSFSIIFKIKASYDYLPTKHSRYLFYHQQEAPIAEPSARPTSDYVSALLAAEKDQAKGWVAEPLTDERTRTEQAKEMRVGIDN